MGEGRRPEEEEGRGGGQRPRGRGAEGSASSGGQRAEVSWETPCTFLSAARPDPRPSRYFLEVWGKRPKFLLSSISLATVPDAGAFADGALT